MEEVRPGAKVRVYEVAKEIGVPNKALVSKIQALGITIKNHMSSIDLDEVQRIKRAMEKERQENLVEKRLTSTVIRRRSKATKKPAPAPTPVEETAPEAEEPVVEPVTEETAQPGADVDTPPPAVEPSEETTEAPIEAPAPEPVADGDEAPAKPADAGEGEASPAVATDDTPAVEGDQPAAEAAEAGEEKPAANADGTAAKPPLKPPLKPPIKGPIKPPPAKPPEKPVVHRYAPGYKPGQQYGPKARQARPKLPTEDKPISAADALKMMGQPRKPRVVITDLDGRRPGQRREVRSGKDLFGGGRYKGPGRRKRRTISNKKTKKTEITTPAQHKRVIRMDENIGVGEIARQMGIKGPEVLKHLWGMGLTRIMINQSIDSDTASLLANEFGYEIEDVSFKEEAVLLEEVDQPEDLQSRPPVVTVMGHVDHGKTSLLDAIRNTSVADSEAGGITQHVGASHVKNKYGEIVFLDTPGHEAFTSMRARGANCTDIVVLVVAANDGVMPQTVEAIDHAKAAEVPIIVAVNKMDLPDANPDRVRSEIAERGLVPEEWGGDVLFVEVSARTKDGVDNLLENINLQAELADLKANPNKLAKGTIIESRLDKAKGAMCSVLVQEGTLHVGDTVVAGEHMGKVRALITDHGKQVKEAGPCSPVEILGLGGVPMAGDILNAVADDKAARVLATHRQDQHRQRDMASGSAGKTYEEILHSIQTGEAMELKLLLKADVHGSAEAVREALVKLGTEKVSVNVISANVGGITENDVNLAKAAGGIIMGFNVRSTGKASQLADREKVEIRIYDVIYEMLDEVKVMMQGLLPKERREKFLGRAEVRETFTIPKVGTIAGCGVQDGKITRNSQLRLVRDNIKIYDGKVKSLKRFKDDVKEVAQGFECGIGIEGYNDVKVGDVIEAYEIEEFAPTL